MKILKVTLTSLIAALACTGIIYAATTVGTNISTTGTLDVTGASTLTGNTAVTGTLGVTGLTTLVNASTTVLTVSGNSYLATTTLAVDGNNVFLIEKTDGTDVFTVDTTNSLTTGAINSGATITVCASDRLSNKWKCDYTTDGDEGTDDGFTITTAINALPSNGGTVQLTEGTFYVGGYYGDGLNSGIDCLKDLSSSQCGISITRDNVTIQGVGPATILKGGKSEDYIDIASVTIDDVNNEFEGTHPFNNGDEVFVSTTSGGIVSTTYYTVCEKATSPDRFKLDAYQDTGGDECGDNDCSTCQTEVDLSGAETGYVSKKIASIIAISPATAGATGAARTSDVIIRDLQADGQFSHVNYLILSWKSDRVIFENLYVTGCGTDGLVFDDDTYDSKAINNTIIDCGQNNDGDQSAGIEIEDGAERILVSGNTISNTVTSIFPHIHVSNVTFTDADFTGDTINKTHGMVDYDRLTLTTSGTLDSNLAEQTIYYVDSVDANNFKLSLNSDLSSPISKGGGGSGTHTLNEPPASDIIMVNNTIDGGDRTTSGGIIVSNGSETHNSGIVVADNTLRNIQSIAINIGSYNKANIESNTITTPTNSCIVTGNNSVSKVVHNQLKNCGDYGINVNGGESTISDNLIDGTTSTSAGHGIWIRGSVGDTNIFYVTNNTIRNIKEGSTDCLASTGNCILHINGNNSTISVFVENNTFGAGGSYEDEIKITNGGGTIDWWFTNNNATGVAFSADGRFGTADGNYWADPPDQTATGFSVSATTFIASNNTFDGSLGNDYCLRHDGGDNAKITGNTFKDCSGACTTFTAGNSHIISGNTFDGCGISGTTAGILVWTDNLRITDNLFTDDGSPATYMDYGVYTFSGADNTVIENNTFIGMEDGDFYWTSGEGANGRAIVRDNFLSGSDATAFTCSGNDCQETDFFHTYRYNVTSTGAGTDEIQLPDGLYGGHRIVIELTTDGGANLEVDLEVVSTAAQASADVCTMTTAGDLLLLEWDGSEWWVIKDTGSRCA